MTLPLDPDSRSRLFARLEMLGLDRVKHDLLEHLGRREVGGAPDVREAAWEWVRMREAETAGKSKAATATLGLIAEARLEELRKVLSGEFDFSKLIRLCEEINVAYREGCYCATAMLTRAVLDHVPPLFSKATFNDVASHYGSRSFKEAMQHLNNASRSVADGHLHEQIRRREALPTAQQVNCAQQLDVLLAEIVRTV